jgi:hypothetical protein
LVAAPELSLVNRREVTFYKIWQQRKTVSPDVLMALNVDLVKLTLYRRHDVPLHLYSDVLGQDRQQQTLLNRWS